MNTRNIVICCDGTSNEFGRKNTNVVRLLQCLQRDTDGQLIYYDPGVGTLPDPNRITHLGKEWTRILGLAFGYGLTKDVLEAYGYLMETWQTGDRLFIFGFSRGAYAARVLAGLLHTLGLMSRGAQNSLPYVIKAYKALSDRNQGEKMRSLEATYADFRRTFARPVFPKDRERHFPVHFLGVWDTVSTVGWVWDPQSFRHTAFNPSIQIARHALAIDEARTFFRQNRFTKAPAPSAGGTDTLECWFPGSHSDVGGGYEGPEDQLWPLSLEWMLAEAGKAGLKVDIQRKEEVLASAAVDKVWTLKHHDSLAGPWNYAERFPALRWRRDPKTQRWFSRFEVGKATPRKIRAGELIHRSSLQRIRASKVILPDDSLGPYQPKSLCIAYQEEVRKLCEPLPEYHPYQPAHCGCQACQRLKAP